MSVISQDTSQVGAFMVRPTDFSLPVTETLCLTFFPVVDRYVLQTELVRSLLYPEEVEMMINETSVEK